jgi:phosphate acyltransferase
MGGDSAPSRIVDGAVLAARTFKEKGFDHQILITGPKDRIAPAVTSCHGDDLLGTTLEIVHTDEYIDMHDSPADALKKKPKSSMHTGVEMVRKGEAHAFISMGNTGAVMAVALLGLGRIEGISRPAIGAYFPAVHGGTTFLLDVGSNVDCKPANLFQFAVMGSIYVKTMRNIENPKVGLVSVGEEDSKGDDTTIKANELFRQQNIFQFVGNKEGRDVLMGSADVLVCDGFIGNIILKFGESVPKFLKGRFQLSEKKSFLTKLGIGIAKPALKGVFREMDYEEFGGVPLLGVNGVVIIGHGSSSARAVFRAVEVAKEMVEKRINEVIREKIKSSNIQ